MDTVGAFAAIPEERTVEVIPIVEFVEVADAAIPVGVVDAVAPEVGIVDVVIAVALDVNFPQFKISERS